ncbi:GNAT family N-acetyltransferase [Mycolicibacterium tokaiense]|nr:GNAT family N-acetyltransferase [Mycolicibacterium tokaiense]BBY86488.1 cellulose biosynthesis protein CelD [Mycolicibacterium tokaiense]
MQVEVITPAELDSAGRSHWKNVQAANPHMGSPFLSPTFVETVGRARKDTRVAVISDGSATAYLPFEKGRHGHARAAGMGLSDVQGIVAPEGMVLDVSAVLNAASLRSLTFDHLVAEQEGWVATGPAAFERDISAIIDLRGGFDTYMAVLQENSKSLARSTARKERKLEREHGPLRFVFHERDHRSLDVLLHWKSQQYRSTGRRDRFANPNTRRLVHELLDAQEDTFTAPLSVLMAGDRVVAAHFGLQSNGVLAWWFPAYYPAFAPYSPGLILTLRTAQALSDEGLSVLDLGKGDESYKRRLSNSHLNLIAGSVAVNRRTHVVMKMRRWPYERTMAAVLASPRLRSASRSMLARAGAARQRALPMRGTEPASTRVPVST